MLLVGLTGGIGSGKSSVAALLAHRGAVIVDADAVARDVVEPGSAGLARLVERFGPGILAPDGSLDRAALARIAFADDASRRNLEAIIHPAVGEEFVRRMTSAPEDAIVVCDVPLLAETSPSWAQSFAAVIVVEAPREARLERLEQRGLTRADAEARMAAQAGDDERRTLADYLIDNSGDRAGLERQVDDVWRDLQRRHGEVSGTGPPAS
jgi:dephospho-CoA kinase